MKLFHVVIFYNSIPFMMIFHRQEYTIFLCVTLKSSSSYQTLDAWRYQFCSHIHRRLRKP